MDSYDDAVDVGRVEVGRRFLSTGGLSELMTQEAAVGIVFNRGVAAKFDITRGIGLMDDAECNGRIRD